MEKARANARRLAVCLALAASACADGVAPDAEGLVGAWRWVEASGGFAGETLTPESTGQSMLLIFGEDGLARVYGEERRDRGTPYEATERSTVTYPVWDVRYDRALFGFETQVASLPTPDELVLADPCCDGYVWRFERLP